MSERKGIGFRGIILLLMVAAGVIVGSSLKCGGLGLGPGWGFGSGTGSAPVASATSTSAREAGTHGTCHVRLDSQGLALEGGASTLEAIVSACKEAGSAELVVTGDARSGSYDELRAALDQARVPYHVRGRPDATAGPSTSAAPSTTASAPER
jgi:hypothetical protein